MQTVSGRFRSSSERLVNNFGTLRNIESVSRVYDEDTQTVVESTSSTETKMYKTSASYQESKDPNIVGKESCAFLIAAKALSTPPKINDRVVDSLGDYYVKIISPQWAGDDVALWRIVCVRD